jgi:beta-alanine--pyruvate transaminase
MDAFWMPYSSNKNFKSKPRLLASAKDMHCYDMDGRKLLDATSGLWCSNGGHCREPIVRAIQEQAAVLDFAPTFHLGHPSVFEFSERLATYFPDELNSVFLTNSGSEADDSALKMALAYHKIRGNGGKQLLVGRERGYHGVGFGGMSVGGIVKNRLWFGNQMLRVDHLPHTHNPQKNGFSRGIPEHGGESYADALQQIIALHDASTIAAVIVEPVSGSAGVLPPPQGYLKRLREICSANDILLIYDEVITAFGRLGKKTAAEYFGVTPDMITFAKGVTSGCAPLGGVLVRDDIRQTFIDAAQEKEIDFFHGYTYSGHPLSVAAGRGALNLYEEEGLMERIDSEGLSAYFEEAIHSLRDCPNVKDIRNIGFMGAVELESIPGKVGDRAFNIFERCFHEKDIMMRVTGDTLAFSPPLIAEKSHLDEIFDKTREALRDYQ